MIGILIIIRKGTTGALQQRTHQCNMTPLARSSSSSSADLFNKAAFSAHRNISSCLVMFTIASDNYIVLYGVLIEYIVYLCLFVIL